MPSQSVHDDLPEYLQPKVVNRIASFIMGRARERRAAAASEPIRVKPVRARAEARTETKATRSKQADDQPSALPFDPVRFNPASERVRGHDRPSER